jgi:peptide/nickel transport system substrate-binding protein
VLKNFLRYSTLVFSFSLILLSASCKSSGDDQTLVYGLTLSPTGIDPHINASAELGIPLTSVYDTLVYQNPGNGQFVPGLAKSWIISDDATTYTFHLRNDVHFHDDTPFDALAAQANFEYVMNPDHLSQKARFMLGPLARTEVLDPYTIALHLEQPFAPLLDSLAQVYLGMASPKALAEWGPGEYQFHQVGTGPYRFVEYVVNDHITLEKNADYAWGPTIFNHDQATIERIIFRFYEDPATRSLALESGDVDIIGELPPQDAERLGGGEQYHVYPVPIPGQPLQFFLNSQIEPTNDILVRRALLQSVDRSFIVETVFGPFSPVAEGPLSMNFLTFSSSQPYVVYDPQSAAALLDENGWETDESIGLRMNDGQVLQLHLVVPNWGSNPEVGQMISAAWESLGAQVTLEVAPGFGPLREAQVAGAYHAIGLNFFGTDPDQLRTFYSTEGLYNWSKNQDTRFDQLLIQASQATNEPERRQAHYEELAALIHEDALILPIRDYVNLVAARSTVNGLRFSTQGWFPYLIDLQLEQ